MSFLKKIFGKKEEVKSFGDFWNWFQKNEKRFSATVKSGKNIEKDFFDELSPCLNQLREEIYYVTGMFDKETVELILTAEGTVRNISFVEELVGAAPRIDGWKFTALKPSLDIKDVNIEMGGYQFNNETLSFHANNLPEYPDEIDITVVHKNWNEEDKRVLTNGTYIFLDNYLGELAFATSIDNLKITDMRGASHELVPIEKLKDFLKWREKEFIEKYEGERHNTENDNYAILEGQLKSGKALVAVINTDLLNWDSKASHPWIAVAKIKYDGSRHNGMPGDSTFHLLDEMEKKIIAELKDFDGYLNIGRQTADGVRENYFACKDFRKPSKVLERVQQDYAPKIEMSYNIYKDKYWQSFQRFNRT
jgi:hypothetical protein